MTLPNAMPNRINGNIDYVPEWHGRFAEAARYTLSRRLAPALRHNMAGTLQPITMVASMLERRLQKPELDLGVLEKNASDIVSLTKEAATSCADLMSWLTPKENQSITLGKGISECLGMVATEFSFQGYGIVNQTKEFKVETTCSAIRNVFTAALLALTDEATAPGNLVVSARLSEKFFSICIELENSGAVRDTTRSCPYRKLEWNDVEALAFEESIQLTHSPNRVVLQFDQAN